MRDDGHRVDTKRSQSSNHVTSQAVATRANGSPNRRRKTPLVHGTVARHLGSSVVVAVTREGWLDLGVELGDQVMLRRGAYAMYSGLATSRGTVEVCPCRDLGLGDVVRLWRKQVAL